MPGRMRELTELEKIYQQSDNQIVLLYGRDHMDKFNLIQDFCQGKKCFFYHARECSEQEQKRMMGRELQQKMGIKFPAEEYDQILNRIKSGDPSKFVLVIHQVESILKKSDELWDSLIRLKEKKLYPGPVMVILCTSNVSWVQRDFKGVVDARIKLNEINFLELVRMFPEASVRESVEIYGILGGVPGYLRRWNQKEDLKTNVCNNILSQNGYLHQEALRYIGAQLRELSVYSTILGSLASGLDKLNDLYKDTGFSRAKISVYMKNLMSFDVIQKVNSMETGGWGNAKKGVYRIKDSFVEFWFHFIFPNLSDLSLMEAETFYDTYIAPSLQEYLNKTFVKVCMEYLELTGQMNQLPIQIHKMGTWEGKKGTIDIVAQNQIRESVVGICHWADPEVTMSMYRKLEDNLKLAKITPKQCYLFTAGKFSPEIVRAAKENHTIRLIDMNRL